MKAIFYSIRNLGQSITATKAYMIILGSLALIWFLIRVIPKPQRATYPCMRASFPLASAFVIWISGILFSRKLFIHAFRSIAHQKWIRSIMYGMLAILILGGSLFRTHLKETQANSRILNKRNDMAERLRSRIPEAGHAEACVAIVQSEKDSAHFITQDDITSMLREAVTLAGGFDTLIHNGDTVVLKPNMIGARDGVAGSYTPFPPKANGVATDYRVIQSVVDLVREYNPDGMVVLLEASGLDNTRDNFNTLGYNQITGLDSVILLDEFQGAWYDSTAADQALVSVPNNKSLLHPKYFLNDIYYKAQVLISLPVLKSHFITGTTGAVKNIALGATPVRMYGNGPDFPEHQKSGRWKMIPHWDNNSMNEPLNLWIHDYYLCRPADYVITDGIQGSQYGPFPGAGMGNNFLLPQVQMNMRLLLAGKDALAVDAIQALVTGNDPYLITHLRLLAQSGVGCINPASIEVKGAPVHQVKKKFREVAPGNFSHYSDFEGPKVSVEYDTLTEAVRMRSDEKVVRIDVSGIPYYSFYSVDSNEHCVEMKLPLPDSWDIDIYDRYLNCSQL